MRTRTPKETAMICMASVLAIGLLIIPLGLAVANGTSTKGAVLSIGIVAAIGVVFGFRYLTVVKRAQLERSGDEEFRRLAEEYRRLADLAITAQEHTDLKLRDVSTQLDFLREQNASLQKILSEVE